MQTKEHLNVVLSCFYGIPLTFKRHYWFMWKGFEYKLDTILFYFFINSVEINSL